MTYWETKAEELWTILGKPAWKLQTIADYLKAAEEHGEKNGLELRKLLFAVRPLVSETFLGAGAMTERGWGKLLEQIDEVLK